MVKRLFCVLALSQAIWWVPVGWSQTARADAPQSSPVGRKIENFQLQDYRGKNWSLADFKDSKLVVVAFLGTECPLVKLYAARLAELDAKYVDQDVAFLGINSNRHDSLAEIAHHAKQHRLEFPVLKDPGNKVADQFGAQRTPEVFVLDGDRVLRYWGLIDDQYHYGVQRPKAEHTYLADALAALLAGEKVEVPETKSIGCHIGRVSEPDPHSKVTYTNQISRILQKRCVSCHREGEIAPFALTDYDEVVGWAEMIDEVVREQRMPPWGASAKYGHFANDASLSDEEKDLIYQWVAAGAPKGDEKDLPPPVRFPEGWRIGQPDVVIKMREKPFKVPAEGEVKYQYFVVDPGFAEDKWIQAAECRAGNRAVVHHIIVAVAGQRLRSAHGLRSDWLAAMAPGSSPLVLPEGQAKFIPAGSKLVFQLHYTPNGTPQEDTSEVGFIFADPKKVKKVVATQKAANTRFAIPPGESDHRVEATHRFDQDTLILSLFPHMHLRGKSFRYTAVYPDGREEILLDVPRYDFNWQNGYLLSEPKRMPKGSKLVCVAHFDNSPENLANPDPTKQVRWGDQTWEEMMIGYFNAALADQDLTKGALSTRTEQFLKGAKRQPPQLSVELRKMATGALASDATLGQFGVALRKQVPQLDRICLSVVDDGQLVVRCCAQEREFKGVGGSGVRVGASTTSLATYAGADKSVVHSHLAKQRWPDLRWMAQAFGSSLHVPVQVDGLKGTVNFWSTETEAFPPKAVSLLEEVAGAMTGEK